jgi:ubiquitin carboxyl-terminal hydrolase 5/13
VKFQKKKALLHSNCVLIGLAGHDEPTDVFAFGMEQRLQCGACKRVRYRVDKMDVLSVSVPARKKPEQDAANPTDASAAGDQKQKTEWEAVHFETCLAALTVPEALEYHCPACARGVIATK